MIETKEQKAKKLLQDFAAGMLKPPGNREAEDKKAVDDNQETEKLKTYELLQAFAAGVLKTKRQQSFCLRKKRAS